MLHARVQTAGFLLTLLLPAAGVAQVGHAPGESPYDDQRVSQYLTFGAAYLTGGRGDAGVGPSDGYLGGVRWDIRLGTPSYAHLGLSAGWLDRVIVDPTLPADTRIQGNVTQSVYMADAGAALVLTGQKTWNHLAPYVGLSLGVVLGGAVPGDSAGFKFATRFHVGPQVGARLHVSDRLHFRVEGRDVLWRLTYPGAFFTPPNPADPPVLDADETKGSQWVHHPTLVLSLGYALRR